MHGINFVHKDINEWSKDCIDSILAEGVNEHSDLFREGRDVWVIQSYIALKRNGRLPVYLSSVYRKDCINIAHRTDVAREDCEQHFVASIRADREPMFYAHYEIVQNKYSVWASNHAYIPHWPQPGLIKREDSRGQTIEKISFFGKACHLKPEFLQNSFKEALAHLSCELKVHENDWKDYSNTDLVMAIRDGHRFYLDFKPASKLVNAWKAGCPILVNREAGYEELKKSNLDFFEAEKPEEVISIIKYLKENPKTYQSMVVNGKKRAAEFDHELITQHWLNVIENQLQPAFQTWFHRPRLASKNRLAYVRARLWGYQATQYPQSKKRLLISLVRVSLAYPSSWTKIVKRYLFGRSKTGFNNPV